MNSLSGSKYNNKNYIQQITCILIKNMTVLFQKVTKNKREVENLTKQQTISNAVKHF